ncbi:orf 67A [Ateline gammaherpesvirus 3]|uniref:Orf 67A n=1 Tax=Ateline herpesvirus 3 TaxID=85618 RepID=Q9YTJ9_ATHV3|nr:orf 67A [Ateline gammaherpesvirus 3]AAC95591.1 orf 67A [Ateline gammaherpesvirus 3]
MNIVIEENDLLYFEPMLPTEIQTIAPSVYAKLNLLNYCQYLKTFIKHKERAHCEHISVLNAKVEAVKQIISKIVETDSVVGGIRS